jgi:glycosyltransferase involved in cell wall biosynthesis
MIFLSVVLPTYNSANWIIDFLNVVDNYLNENYKRYEIIVVDDCSSDETKGSLKCVKNENVHVYTNNKREGQHFTTWLGIKMAKGDIVVTIDDDGEYLPNQIGILYQEWLESNCDVVYGIPNSLKRGGLKIFFYKLYLANLRRRKENRKSSFRLISRSFLDKCNFEIYNVMNIDKYFETLNVKNTYVVVAYCAGNRGRYSLFDYLKALFIATTYKP